MGEREGEGEREIERGSGRERRRGGGRERVCEKGQGEGGRGKKCGEGER